MDRNKQSHTISILTANKPGVLVRISMVFARRGYNIDSLVVSRALDGKFSRMTIMAEGELATLDQIIKQLTKLVDIVHAEEHTSDNSVESELALFKVKASDDNRTALLQLIEHFKGITLDFTGESLVIQITADILTVDAFEEMLTKYGIIEMVRTGKVLMRRGSKLT
jgi:acetolactate synthase-1/3 small subunit